MAGVNSYDGSSPAGFDYGAQRLVCLNDAKVFTKIHEIRIKHIGKDKVNFEYYAVPMLENIEKTVEGIRVNYRRLNQEEGNPYLKLVLIQQTFASFMSVMWRICSEAQNQPEGGFIRLLRARIAPECLEQCTASLSTL